MVVMVVVVLSVVRREHRPPPQRPPFIPKHMTLMMRRRTKEGRHGELSSSSNRRLLRRNLNGSWDGAASASSSLTSIPAPVKYVGSPCLRLTYGGGRLFRPIVYLVLQLNSFNVCVCGTPPMSIYGLFIRLILLFETSSLSMYMD